MFSSCNATTSRLTHHIYIFAVKDESAINTPAVAAAFAIKSYDARNDNEISLEVSPSDVTQTRSCEKGASE